MAETFEKHLAALEKAVERLESGEESLEGSLTIFEGAVGHLKSCHEILTGAEAKIRVLTKDGGDEEFDPPEE